MHIFAKTRYRILLLMCAAAILFSGSGCKKATIQFGDQFIDGNYTNIVLIDTISPVISTVFRDSTVTSQTGKLLLGSYQDPLFGHISSSTFFVMGSPSGLPDFHISAMYDSLVLRMVGDSTFYGDTTISQRLQVQQLNETISFADGETSLYNTSNFSVNNAVSGAVNMFIQPSRKDTVTIRLSDAQGEALWSLINDKATEVTTATDFEQYFKGLKISPENPGVNAAVYGFSDTVVMRLYYHESNPDVVQKYIDFTLASRNKQFNQIKYSRTGTLLDVTIPEDKEIAAVSLHNAAYIQPLTGAIMKLRFPNIREALLQRTDFLQLMSAELILPPLGGSYSYNFMLPPQLSAYATNINNTLGGVLGLTGSTGSASAQYGDLTTDWLYGQDTYYKYDVTSYLQQQLDISGDNTNGLLFLPPSPSYNTTFNRAAFGNSQTDQPVRLKVYYISVQQDQ
ncbi:MAG: DUF4270 family protein [Chitinophagaceae bacterium]|nr:DUF4270 family protein [Chitinophagaceae bacterium]